MKVAGGEPFLELCFRSESREANICVVRRDGFFELVDAVAASGERERHAGATQRSRESQELVVAVGSAKAARVEQGESRVAEEAATHFRVGLGRRFGLD